MPLPNNHACLIDGTLKVVGSQTRTHAGKRYTVRIGKKAGKSGSGERSYLYPIDEWSKESAQAHCRSHGGTFEPASGKVENTEMDMTNPMVNPWLPDNDQEEK